MRGSGAAALVLAVMAATADVSGTWTGTIRNAGASDDRAAKIVLHLTQRGMLVTGTAGNDVAHQSEIRNGHFAGDSVEFDVPWGNTAHFSLAPHGDELTGEMRGDPKEAPPGKRPVLLAVALKRR